MQVQFLFAKLYLSEFCDKGLHVSDIFFSHK